MKLYVCLIVTSCLLVKENVLHGQSRHPADYSIKVKTDYGMFKGLLTNIMDSSIEITTQRNGTKTILPAAQINLIKVRKPLLTNITKGIAGGAGAGVFLVVLYYLDRFWEYGYKDPSDPSFGKALWSTALFGAGAGFIYGGFESIFIHKKISINKALYMFESRKSKLKKYLYY